MPASLPPDHSRPLELADWLELSALEAGDLNASSGDLSAALQLAVGGSSRRAREVTEGIEADVLSAMWEVEERVRNTGRAYPFSIKRGRVVQANDDWTESFAYVFCLALSYYGYSPKKGDEFNPWHVFEEVALIAAKNFIDGEAVRFANLRDGRSFAEAVDELCLRMGEGGRYQTRHRLRPQDDKLDLVAWRDFYDRRESKLILFGQCAAGANWATKISELQPTDWTQEWMAEGPVSPLVRSFYIPHRIDADRWPYYSRRAGIFFDRCRIAAWVPYAGNEGLADQCLEWVSEQLNNGGAEADR